MFECGISIANVCGRRIASSVVLRRVALVYRRFGGM
jgi:hypothetical protein